MCLGFGEDKQTDCIGNFSKIKVGGKCQLVRPRRIWNNYVMLDIMQIKGWIVGVVWLCTAGCHEVRDQPLSFVPINYYFQVYLGCN